MEPEPLAAGRERLLERRRQVAASMRDILTVLNSDLPMDAVLEAIAIQARSLLNADAVAIYQLGADGLLTVCASAGLAAEELLVMRLSIGRSASGAAVLRRIPTVVTTAETAFLADVAAHRATLPPEQRPLLDRLITRIHTLLAVPLLIKDETFGALSLYFEVERTFSDEDLSLAQTFAEQVALAIENARLRERAERAAALEERARLARDLHDSVTQSLYSLTLFAEAGRRLAGSGDLEQTARYLERLGSTAQQALKEMRLLVHQLRPLALDKEGLVSALQHRLDAVEGRAGIQTRLLVEGPVELPAAVEAELYHMAQEALNNALKHAAATAVTVRIKAAPMQVRLEVADNGQGFDPNLAVQSGGLGLTSLRERAANVGGNLIIDSEPGRGTRIVVEYSL